MHCSGSDEQSAINELITTMPTAQALDEFQSLNLLQTDLQAVYSVETVTCIMHIIIV